MLLDRCERVRARGLTFDELCEIARLYRLHTARLARVRGHDDSEAVHHLNALCVRGYTFLYARVSDHPPRGVRQPLLLRFERTVGRTWQVQALAWALLAAGLVVGGALATRDPNALYAFVPVQMGYTPEMLDRLVASPAARAEFLAGSAMHPALNALFGSSLFVHNTRVGLLSFATGMLAGVPTVLLQVYNGVLIGAFASIFLHGPSALPFLAWILPHAIPELTAVTLCAAAGLLLGRAVAMPGRRSRADAVRDAVEPALLLLAGAVPLFAVAAVIESFVRESMLGTAARLGVAGLMAATVLGALLLTRRLAHRFEVDTSWLRDVVD